jgi:hypothetical protein
VIRKALILTVGLGLTACASEFHSPIVGVIGNERAQGQATARMDGNGTFQVMTARGLECTGRYDSRDMNPTIRATATCNDGRTGTCIITRNIQRMTGTAICSDSRREFARFVFGDVSFAEAFGESRATTN